MRRMWAVCAIAVLALTGGGSAVADDKSEAAAEFSRGLAAMSRGDLAQAAKSFDAVAKLDPQAFEAHNNLAVIYTEQGNYDAALKELEKVVALKPDYYRGRKNLAELYVRLAHDAFLQAAAVAPMEDKGNLENRAKLIGSPPGTGAPGTAVGGVLETAGGAAPRPAAEEKVAAAPAAAALATPKPEAAPTPAEVAKAAAPAEAPKAAPAPVASDGSPAAFISLVEGVPGIALSDAGLRLYRQHGGDVQPAERIPLKLQPAKLPATAEFYVAASGEGRVDLVPLDRGGRGMTIRDSNSGKADLVVDPAAFTILQQAVQPYLSPVAIGAVLPPINEQAAEDKHLAVLGAFTRWMKSWQSKDLNGYLDSYVADYNPRGGPGAQKWKEQRAKVFERSGDIQIQLSDPVILETGDSVVTLTRQEYRSKLQSSIGVKRLTWSSTPQGWKITTEEMLSEKIQKNPG